MIPVGTDTSKGPMRRLAFKLVLLSEARGAPHGRRQTLWTIAGVVILAILAVALMTVAGPISQYATAQPQNATLVGALLAGFIALLGILVNQIVNTRLARSGAQDDAMAAYLKTIGDLLTDKKLLDHDSATSPVRALARAQTLAVLEQIDQTRKRTLLQFLYEAGLIFRDETIVNLAGANLVGTLLTNAALRNANLSGAKLWLANLKLADLREANLREAKLSVALLKGADLSEANLRQAAVSLSNLRGADLSKAELKGARAFRANLRGANLSRANLSKVTVPWSNLRGANLRGANLWEALLSWSNLREADLREANLGLANLRGANLSGANLRGAFLDGAKGADSKKLAQVAESLQGATMPDGSRYS